MLYSSCSPDPAPIPHGHVIACRITAENPDEVHYFNTFNTVYPHPHQYCSCDIKWAKSIVLVFVLKPIDSQYLYDWSHYHNFLHAKTLGN